MQLFKDEISLPNIDELKILQNVRIISKNDLHQVESKENLNVRFELSGDIKGSIVSYLCLDGHTLSTTERNYFIPLFVESMNILIGKKISSGNDFKNLKLKLFPPKLILNSSIINTANKNNTYLYLLELEEKSFNVLLNYELMAIN